MSLYSKIRGTIETIFQIGLGGPNIKNSAGVVEARDAADAAYAIVRGDTPVASNDLTTKSYVDGVIGGADVVSTIRFALDNSASQASTATLPANARVWEILLSVTTPYSAGATITIGHTGSATAFHATTDNDAETAGDYLVKGDIVAHTSASTVQVAVAGTPVAGAGTCTVLYSETPAV